MTPLQQVKDSISIDLYGMTTSNAIKNHLCISCKKKIDFKLMKKIDINEYHISGLCPSCFNSIFRPVED